MDPKLRERWKAWNSQWNHKASNVRTEESLHDCWKIIGYWSLKFRNYQSMILGMPILQNIPLTLPYAMGIILGVFSLLISLSLFFFFFGFVLIVCGGECTYLHCNWFILSLWKQHSYGIGRLLLLLLNHFSRVRLYAAT